MSIIKMFIFISLLSGIHVYAEEIKKTDVATTESVAETKAIDPVSVKTDQDDDVEFKKLLQELEASIATQDSETATPGQPENTVQHKAGEETTKKVTESTTITEVAK